MLRTEFIEAKQLVSSLYHYLCGRKVPSVRAIPWLASDARPQMRAHQRKSLMFRTVKYLNSMRIILETICCWFWVSTSLIKLAVRVLVSDE